MNDLKLRLDKVEQREETPVQVAAANVDNSWTTVVKKEVKKEIRAEKVVQERSKTIVVKGIAEGGNDQVMVGKMLQTLNVKIAFNTERMGKKDIGKTRHIKVKVNGDEVDNIMRCKRRLADSPGFYRIYIERLMTRLEFRNVRG